MKLKDYQKKIIELRINGLTILELPANEVKVLIDVTIFKVSAISGFALATTPEFADVLNEEFRILLSEYGFDNLTFDEIVTAFRMNARGGYRHQSGEMIEKVKSYSQFFSIDFAADVLNKYMTHRNVLDSLIKNELEGYSNGNIDHLVKKYS